jgi:hypothetical protein
MRWHEQVVPDPSSASTQRWTSSGPAQSWTWSALLEDDESSGAGAALHAIAASATDETRARMLVRATFMVRS